MPLSPGIGSCPGKSTVGRDRAWRTGRRACWSSLLSNTPPEHRTVGQVLGLIPEIPSLYNTEPKMPAAWPPEWLPGPPVLSPTLIRTALKYLIALLAVYYLSPPGVEALGGWGEVGLAHYCFFGTQHRPWKFKGLNIC